MTLVRWNPFREIEDMQSRLNRFFATMPELPDGDGTAMTFTSWRPAVDVQEDESEYVIKADLPEVQKNDVKVEMLDGALTIEGERKQEKEEHGRRYHSMERAYGKFLRRFTLPSGIDAGKVKADFKDGVLRVHLPKTAKSSPKAIDVSVS